MFDFIKPSFWFKKRESALGGETVRSEQLARFNALYGCDPDKIASAVTSFACGYLGPIARIIEEFERRDDKMMVGSMKMKASVGRCDYQIRIKEGFENDPRAKIHADTLKKFWSTIRTTDRFKQNERGGFRLLRKQMMEAQSYGFAVHEIVWTPTADGSIRAEFIRMPLWHFENKTGALRFLRNANASDGVEMVPGEWLVTTGDGVGIAASIVAMAKRLSFQDWLLFSERSGMPIIIGKTGATFGSDQWNRLRGLISAIYRDTRALVDSGTTIEAIQTGSTANLPFPALIEWADRAIAALYRGADLSTISKGEGTGASLQGEESGMLEQDAVENLGEALHEQVDKFVIRYVTGDDEPLAYVSIEPTVKQDVDTDIKIDNHLAKLGVKLSKRDALQRYGRIEAASDDDALELKEQQQTPGLPGFANEVTGAPSRRGTDKQPADGILSAFAQDTGPAADAIAEFLEAPGKDAAEALMKRLPDLIPEDPAMAAVIAEAMAKEFGKFGLANAGTSEGAKKGWETRRRNGWSAEQAQEFKAQVCDLGVKSISDRSYNETVKLGSISGDVVSDIKAKVGIDVSGFEQEISSQDIRHAHARHGFMHVGRKGKIQGETRNDQLPLGAADYARITDVYSTYDSIERGSPENGSNQASIRYKKKYPDGTLVFIEVIAEKNRVLRFKDGWKEKPSA